MLVDRPGDRDVLPERSFGELGQERVQLGACGGVTVDVLVGLLEGQVRRHGDAPFAAVAAAQVADQGQEALVVNVAAQLGLALDRYQAPCPGPALAVIRTGRPNV